MSELSPTQRLENQLLVGVTVLRAAQHARGSYSHLHSAFLCVLAALCWKHQVVTTFDLLLGLTASLFGVSKEGVALLATMWILNRLSAKKPAGLRHLLKGLAEAVLMTISLGCLTSFDLAVNSFGILTGFALALRLFHFDAEFNASNKNADEKRFLISLPFISMLFLNSLKENSDGYRLCSQCAVQVFTLGAVVSKVIQRYTMDGSRLRSVLFASLWIALIISCVRFLFWESVPIELWFEDSGSRRQQQTLLIWFVIRELYRHVNVLVYWIFVTPLSIWIGVKFAIKRPQGGNQWRNMKDKHRYILGRKYFHLVIVLAALPALFSVSLDFAAIAWIVVLCIYVLLELFRALNILRLNEWLQAHIFPYADERDQHGFIITPLMLILGTSATILLENALHMSNGSKPQILSASLGLVSAGVADAFAAIGGTWTQSPHPLPYTNNGKTIEGSAAFFISFVGSHFSIACLAAEKMQWKCSLASAVAATVFEGYTDYIDNFVVALVAYVTYRVIGT
eukprot:Gregarina_sp_Poly_1__1062@NODE_125_length_13444_cov_91_472378_g111_i0_p2_GENE_NODE_125_length_13444_cov_91_472378_g111_i0NODE_125_length_13444_cov_91_472378_g111_i0_p2_ORF_typecomplete_len511_score48_69CTP_transf_1/PF01148_20/2_4e02CTP_transf_1/PF01148_20/3_1e05GPI2/PF06432_11/8_5_NODE_125_length_13444_cov_91_472378_g111_i010512583